MLRFCSNCNKSFSSSVASINKPVGGVDSLIEIGRTLQNPKIRQDLIKKANELKELKKEEYKDEDGYYEPVTEVPDLDCLEVELDIPRRGETIGQLAPNLRKKTTEKIPKKKSGRPAKNK